MLNYDIAKKLKIGDVIYFVSLCNTYYDAFQILEISDKDIKINDYCGSYLSYLDCGDRLHIKESDAISSVLRQLRCNYLSLNCKIKNLEHKLKI